MRRFDPITMPETSESELHRNSLCLPGSRTADTLVLRISSHTLQVSWCDFSLSLSLLHLGTTGTVTRSAVSKLMSTSCWEFQQQITALLKRAVP
ncbi:hypothetical protein Q7C36_011254 [Tachysurus vachellii]|uniref:Uncharacterized protein n=1 Tax=Tachysurus vachellii TaxID=175792 RepID=A0AA88MR62_TACVA|nr:hypothetical protein Q7C36_011254 [Tachysurus vachellii]